MSNITESLRVRSALRESVGELTVQHAASSHGRPVLVIGSIAYGPAEVCGGWHVDEPLDDDLRRALYRSAKDAGYGIVTP